MATEKVTVPMQNQILELHRQGRSERAIAKIVGKNRRTVSRIIERGTVASPGAVVPDWARLVDWEKVRLEVSRGVQINILAREHAGRFHRTEPPNFINRIHSISPIGAT